MPHTPDPSSVLAISALSTKHKTAFELRPDADHMATIAAELGLQALRKLRFTGHVAPLGKRDWQLSGQLGATVVQPCAVSLEPVTTRIDVPVSRRYLADFQEPQGVETEMPEDDTAEALPETLALEDIMREALDLALPLFPRADGVALSETQFAGPGVTPMSDDDAKPFASLAGLRDKLADPDAS